MPKGVEVEHRNVVNLLLAGRDLFGFTESDRWLATSTVAFDLSVAELFIPLVTGGVVVLRDRRLLQDPHGLVKVIRDHGVTMFQTVPSVWSVLLSEIPDFPRIRVIATTGEAAAPDLARRLADVADEVWNLYGPTETTVWATGHRLQRNETGALSASAPIGRPLANVEARVLDEHRRPVPAGTEGELWIGGAGLGRGYCGNEQLTRERFAVLGQDGRRFYRTGDVVVADVDGTLHYFGRCDDQMKVRGVRIEPMEVESAILACPGVTQAAATWFATASGSRSIVAAVVARPDLTISAEDLRRFLEQQLPSAMIPSRFIFCDALPMSPSGKVDRKAIRGHMADLRADPATASGREALTVTESTLIGIWERTLNVSPVARGDHFFTIGGDSLSAVTMMLEVEATFDISLPFRVAFEAPTLEQLAERIDRAQAQQLARMNAPLQTDELCNAAFVFPLSQQGRGIPIFFNNVNLRMAHKGMWNLDCPLYAVSQWAQGSGFAKAKSVEELARVQIDGIRSISTSRSLPPRRVLVRGPCRARNRAPTAPGRRDHRAAVPARPERAVDGWLPSAPPDQEAHATTGLEPSQCLDLRRDPCARDTRSDQWTTAGVGVDQLPPRAFLRPAPEPHLSPPAAEGSLAGILVHHKAPGQGLQPLRPMTAKCSRCSSRTKSGAQCGRNSSARPPTSGHSTRTISECSPNRRFRCGSSRCAPTLKESPDMPADACILRNSPER